MRRSRIAGFGAFVDADGSREMMRRARRAAGRQMQMLQTQRVTTSKAHKAQYIAAFVEAQSAALAHRHAIEVRYAGLALPAALLPAGDAPLSFTNTALSSDYAGQEEGVDNQRLAAKPVGRQARDRRSVAFGAWRSDATRVLKALHAVDVRVHCIVHEARTPPAFAPAALRRCLTCHLPCVQAYLAALPRDCAKTCAGDNNRDRKACNAPATELFCVKPFCELLCRLQHRDTAGQAEGEMAHVRRSLVSLTLQSLVRHHGWPTAQVFLQWYMSDSGLMTAAASSCSAGSRLGASPARGGAASAAGDDTPVRAEVSQHVAVLCEAVRYEQTESMTMDDLETLCSYAVEVLRKAGAVPRLLPVVAAPVLSLVPKTVPTDVAQTAAAGRSTSTLSVCADAAIAITSGAAVTRVHRLVRRYLLQPASARGGASLGYMPAIGWAEYIRAVYRAGAGPHEVRCVVDQLSDPTRTRHAERLLRDVRVWNASLFCADAPHAVQIYERDLPHHGVVENAATTAALMEALLRPPRGTDAACRATDGGGAGLSRAECVQRACDAWRRLQARAGTLCVGTCSVFEAVIHLHETRRDLPALLRLCVDYDGFLVYFGADKASWVRAGSARLLRHVAEIYARDGSAPFVAAFRAAAAATHTGHDFPPAVQRRLLQAIETLQDQATRTVSHDKTDIARQSGEEELTAEMLSALL